MIPGRYDFPTTTEGSSFGRRVKNEEGDLAVLPFEIETDFNITGYTIDLWFRVNNLRKAPALKLSSASEEEETTILIDTANSFILPVFIVNVPCGVYDYDVRITSPTGDITILLNGTFTVTQKTTGDV